MVPQTSSLNFRVSTKPPELVVPATPTPRELKLLSDIDDQLCLRLQIPLVFFYGYRPSMAGKDPVQVIRQALAKTLVFYYPFAGRLRESPNGKLMVDCNGEGVIFVEADADVTIEQFGDNLLPPFPCFDKILFNIPGSDGIIDSPILHLQVTRLKCGGFIFALRFIHNMCDASGIGQFLKALAEIACGGPNPSILPVWHREMLCARHPPRVTYTHDEYQEVPPDTRSMYEPKYCSFFFGPKEIASIRALLPHHVATKSTSFEVLTAWLWRSYTTALKLQNPDQEIHLLIPVNARFGHCRFNPPLPDGFYGNAMVLVSEVTTVGKLLSHPLGYALELVKKAKYKANEDYVRSVVDFVANKERACFPRSGSFGVTDHTKAGFTDVNFGWGNALYNGVVAKGGMGYMLGACAITPHTNSNGEQGRAVLMSVPEYVLEMLEKEIGQHACTHMLMSNL
ncbi:13-hydroxylupanine O-tigloyltransferase [Cajanus cajan]|uniref:Taxadien-5-alpha-ol O-acetyltransferase n=1 Tax=Cajanus cajan TaxID=3821 RepID=A0A151QQC5_CAJCA|nr:13-hydroxylupanine O-tigloyltransferase [Cajanus cajan]KYP32485.1 Taxadien-5-alpha-ol O-acetyltransferase [Cajanus cajan]